MYLTRFSDVGLRIMMYLSKEQRETPSVTIAEIAQQFDIPRNHVVKITARLVKSGWVHSTRGRTGGLRLAMAPSEIRIGQVIRQLENREELIQCEALNCRLSSHCGLRSVLKVALDQFYAALDDYTLQDITADKTGVAILKIQQAYVEQIAVKH